MKIIENNFRHPLHDALPRQVTCESCKSSIELETPDDVAIITEELRYIGPTPVRAIWHCPCCGNDNTFPLFDFVTLTPAI